LAGGADLSPEDRAAGIPAYETALMQGLAPAPLFGYAMPQMGPMASSAVLPPGVAA
jgi:hypothetical protein